MGTVFIHIPHSFIYHSMPTFILFCYLFYHLIICSFTFTLLIRWVFIHSIHHLFLIIIRWPFCCIRCWSLSFVCDRVILRCSRLHSSLFVVTCIHSLRFRCVVVSLRPYILRSIPHSLYIHHPFHFCVTCFLHYHVASLHTFHLPHSFCRAIPHITFHLNRVPLLFPFPYVAFDLHSCSFISCWSLFTFICSDIILLLLPFLVVVAFCCCSFCCSLFIHSLTTDHFIWCCCCCCYDYYTLHSTAYILHSHTFIFDSMFIDLFDLHSFVHPPLLNSFLYTFFVVILHFIVTIWSHSFVVGVAIHSRLFCYISHFISHHSFIIPTFCSFSFIHCPFTFRWVRCCSFVTSFLYLLLLFLRYSFWHSISLFIYSLWYLFVHSSFIHWWRKLVICRCLFVVIRLLFILNHSVHSFSYSIYHIHCSRPFHSWYIYNLRLSPFIPCCYIPTLFDRVIHSFIYIPHSWYLIHSSIPSSFYIHITFIWVLLSFWYSLCWSTFVIYSVFIRWWLIILFTFTFDLIPTFIHLMHSLLFLHSFTFISMMLFVVHYIVIVVDVVPRYLFVHLIHYSHCCYLFIRYIWYCYLIHSFCCCPFIHSHSTIHSFVQ